MKTIKILLAITFGFLCIFSGDLEAKQHHKQHHGKQYHSGSGKSHFSYYSGGHHKNKKTYHHNSKKSWNKSYTTTARQQRYSTQNKVHTTATKNFQQNGNYTQPQISNHAFQHIQDRHWHNAKKAPYTSYFNQNMTAQKLNNLAVKTINQGSQRPSNHGQGRSTYQYRFQQPIGTTIDGQAAHSLRVVTDANMNVITAFPVR